MKSIGHWISQHRNAFLMVLLAATMLISWQAKQQELQAASTTVDIPVTEVVAVPLSPLEVYRQQRDQDTRADIAALEKLIAQTTLDASTREAATTQLQDIIANRQAQTSLEGALSSSILSPCVAVVQGNHVTIVTEKAEITKQDSALVLTLAAAHTGAEPANVRIISTQE